MDRCKGINNIRMPHKPLVFKKCTKRDSWLSSDPKVMAILSSLEDVISFGPLYLIYGK